MYRKRLQEPSSCGGKGKPKKGHAGEGLREGILLTLEKKGGGNKREMKKRGENSLQNVLHRHPRVV